MGDLLARLSGEDVGGIIVCAGGVIFAVTLVVSVCWYKIRKSEIAAALKQDMLNRGMSAEEIKTVIEAGRK